MPGAILDFSSLLSSVFNRHARVLATAAILQATEVHPGAEAYKLTLKKKRVNLSPPISPEEIQTGIQYIWYRTNLRSHADLPVSSAGKIKTIAGVAGREVLKDIDRLRDLPNERKYFFSVEMKNPRQPESGESIDFFHENFFGEQQVGWLLDLIKLEEMTSFLEINGLNQIEEITCSKRLNNLKEYLRPAGEDQLEYLHTEYNVGGETDQDKLIWVIFCKADELEGKDRIIYVPGICVNSVAQYLPESQELETTGRDAPQPPRRVAG